MIVYVYDSNVIMSAPMKNRKKESHMAAFQEIHKLLVRKGLRPIMQRLKNEASKMLKEFSKTKTYINNWS